MTTERALIEATPSIIRATVNGFTGRAPAQPVLLRAPIPAGGAVPSIGPAEDGSPIRAAFARSALEAHELLRTRSDGEWLVLLTDQRDEDLGAGVLAHVLQMKSLSIDPWESVQQQFKASTCAASFINLREARQVAHELILAAPQGGWDAAPGGVLTRDHALDQVITHHLGLRTPVDLQTLVRWSLGGDAARTLAALTTPGRETLAPLVLDRLAEQTSLTSHAARIIRPLLRPATDGRPGIDSLAAIGVAVGALTSATLTPDQRGDANVALARAESWWGGQVRSTDPALETFGAGVTAAVQNLLALPTEEPRARAVLGRADELLDGIQARHLAVGSPLLPSSLQAASATLGHELLGFTPGDPASLARVEEAWARIAGHRLNRHEFPELRALAAGVRLARWLSTPEVPSGTPLPGLVRAHLDAGAWAESAANDAAGGASDAATARGIESLMHRVQARRDSEARAFATALAADPGAADPERGILLIEDVLARVLHPLARTQPVLLVVLDGMGAAAGTSIAAAAIRQGWEEISLPHTQVDGRRAGALAVLPTLTRYSRTSLLTGRLRDGGSDNEREGFTAYCDQVIKVKAQLFHKGSVDATRQGWALNDEVSAAISDTASLPVVGVVLNTIDDALAKSDPGIEWTLDSVKHLEPILASARAAGRTVVLTGDHGHVIERRTQNKAGVQGASSARSRAGAEDPGPDEVAVSGPRVLAPGHHAVLAVTDTLRYTSLKAGYHGGAHPAEVVVPVILLRPVSADDGCALPPQEPSWWSGHLLPEAPVNAAPALVRVRSRRPAPPLDAPTLLDLPAAPPPAGPGATTAGQRVVDSPAYAAQLRVAGRVTIPPERVAAIIDALLRDPGHRLTPIRAAQVLNIAEHRVGFASSQLWQLLNVDGYEVLTRDVDGRTLILDPHLLNQQFGVSLA